MHKSRKSLKKIHSTINSLGDDFLGGHMRIELEEMDYRQMERESAALVREGKKIVLTATASLELAEKFIEALGKETERKRIFRERKEREELKKK